MIDIDLIRNNTEYVYRELKKRVDYVDLDNILALDQQRRNILSKVEKVRAQRKRASKEIGKLRAAGSITVDLEIEASALGDEITQLTAVLTTTEKDLRTLLMQLPNILDERVPEGDKENNQVIRVWGEQPKPVSHPLDHVELCTQLGLVDYSRGTKLGGNGFWIYTGMGAALEWALIDFFCREHFTDGYEFILPPHLLLDECGYATGQFPKFYDDVFHIQSGENNRNSFLLPTAETAILNIYRDEILVFNQLPIKSFSYTPSYRRESGSHRSEERGTIRGHQFNKVEMFQFVTPETWEEALKELVRKAEQLMEKLGLHYRTSLLSARDASATMALTYDVEVWLPSIQTYKEVSSASWARDYQARRANIKFRRDHEKNTEYVHTLNASGLATSRVMPAIVEQFQQEDGSLLVPEPLRAWLGTDIIRPPR